MYGGTDASFRVVKVATKVVPHLVNWATFEWVYVRPRANQNPSWSVGVVLRQHDRWG